MSPIALTAVSLPIRLIGFLLAAIAIWIVGPPILVAGSYHIDTVIQSCAQPGCSIALVLKAHPRRESNTVLRATHQDQDRSGVSRLHNIPHASSGCTNREFLCSDH